MQYRAILKKDYKLILDIDKKVYPTEFPVTKETITKWYQRNSEFGMIYEENSQLKGINIVIPLTTEGWKKLTSGKLSESELDEKTIFNNLRDREIGLHIYHIEKFDNTIKNFSEYCIKDLAKEINKLRKNNPSLKITGLSGLCVTQEGINLFKNKLNCKEREYLCKEHIFEKEGKRYVINIETEKELSKKIKEGYTLINRCQMLITYPNEESIVWKYLN